MKSLTTTSLQEQLPKIYKAIHLKNEVETNEKK